MRMPVHRYRNGVTLSGAVILLVSTVLAVAVQASAVGAAIDRAFEPARFALLSRPASGRVTIVEMDAASTAAIDRWPWQRHNYAVVVDRLRAAGAASIVFDVDFSSSSNPADDRAFAAALSRAGGLVALPTFGQQARSGDRRNLDAMPLALFRPHVALASVSIAPDEDGLVRHAPLGTVTEGTPHPSLSAYIARRSGRADQEFPIDFAIRPDGIARLSFVAVRDGRFDPSLVRGRDVLIGATAIEMGDRYATPRWSNLPGVVIQALAAETLIRGIPREASGGVAIVLALLLALPAVALRRAWQVAAVIGTALALLVAATCLAQASGLVVPMAGGLALVVAAGAGCLIRDVLARFRRQRLIDEESGLPNRRALLARDTTASRDAALLVLIVDNHDRVAAVLPHGGATQLINRLADRLRLGVGHETVYRLSDRALAVDVPTDDIDTLIGLLRTAMLAPVEVAGRRIDAAVSFGVSPAGPDRDHQVNAALLAAEQAARGGLTWKMAGADLGHVEQDVSLLGELDEALGNGGVSVHYQAKLAVATGRIVGAEALVRWRTATGDFIPPSTFVPLAEQANRIGPLTLFVLQAVLRVLAGWDAAGYRPVVAVNISARLLGDAAFDLAVERLLAAASVPASRLIFEVTESATLADPEASRASLERFHRAGVALSMDDYGTGQSTLTYLRELPLAELKIDRSFVQHAAHDAKDAAMVRSTVDLAHELGLKVVAEGVEDEHCLDFLRSIGCDVAQGYLIGRPEPAERFLARAMAEPAGSGENTGADRSASALGSALVATG